MKLTIFLATIFVSANVIASTCYQVSAFEGAWFKTPELLCIDGAALGEPAVVTLSSGFPFSRKVIATFNLELLERAKCIDCNVDVYGLSNPSNSSFNALAIRFNGTRDASTMKEEGTVKIGATTFFYRSL